MTNVSKIFVNLPVRDLAASMGFFKELGFSFNAQFTNDAAACMVISDSIYAMLLTEPMFQGFTPKKIADAKTTSEVLTALALDSKAAVDRLADDAVKAGGREPREAQDHGFMYSRAFEDPDGHIWEPFWMDPNYVHKPAGTEAAA